MEVKFTDWRNAITDTPTKDGEYAVIKVYKGKFASINTLTYSVEYGWNASAQCQNTRIDFREDLADGFSHFWSEVTINDATNNKEG